MKSLSNTLALIPAYNEEKNIEEVIRRCKTFTKNIIVIDDGSIDKTKKIADKLNVTILSHKKNLGKGEAIKTGTHHILRNLPNIENIVIVDADMQYNPKGSTKLLRPLINKEADFIMGYRNWKRVPFRHRLGNIIWRFIFNLMFRTNLKDVACGFVAMNRKALKNIEDMYGGYIIESSMLAQCITKNLRIKQVPIEVTYKNISGITRGIRMVSGVLIFIIKKGLKYKPTK